MTCYNLQEAFESFSSCFDDFVGETVYRGDISAWIDVTQHPSLTEP
jgi:hypothetical protein